jgi:hypothetical protein
MDGGNTGEIGARELVAIYREQLRPGLAQQLPSATSELDVLARDVDSCLAARDRLEVAFVGESQVGKSTLVNALIGRRILPAGGTGPLTANAIRVAYGTDSLFEATFHSVERVHDLLQGLLAVRRAPAGRAFAHENSDILWDEAYSMLAGGVADVTSLDNETLVGCLKAVVDGSDPRSATSHTGLQARINVARRLLGTTEVVRQSDLGSTRAFRAELDQRASGWMATLIASISLEVSIPAVQSLDLVDLPGLGTVADAARRTAIDKLQRGFDTLVVVVRNSGLTRPVVDALSSPPLRGILLGRLREDLDGCPLIIATTHLDDVVRSRYRALVADACGEGPFDADALFQQLGDETSRFVRAQLSQLLCELIVEEDGGLSAANAARMEAAALADRVTLVSVAALEYLQLLEGFADDAVLKREDSTNVPAMRSALRRLGERRASARAASLARSVARLREQLVPVLSQLAAKLQPRLSQALLAPSPPGREPGAGPESVVERLARFGDAVAELRRQGAPGDTLSQWERAQIEAYVWARDTHGLPGLEPDMLVLRRQHAGTLFELGRHLDAFVELATLVDDYATLVSHDSGAEVAYELAESRLALSRELLSLGQDEEAAAELRELLASHAEAPAASALPGLGRLVQACREELRVLGERLSRSEKRSGPSTALHPPTETPGLKYHVHVRLYDDETSRDAGTALACSDSRTYEVVADSEAQALELARHRLRGDRLLATSLPTSLIDFHVEPAHSTQIVRRGPL